MTGIAIALSFIALFWIAYTNFGENDGAAGGAPGETGTRPQIQHPW